jgi:hypothetical protein
MMWCPLVETLSCLGQKARAGAGRQCADRDILDLGLRPEWAQDRKELEAHLVGTV